MHDEAFADAARPAPCVILSLLMRPYAIGHEITLLQQRNPLVLVPIHEFIQLPIENRRAAIMKAALVCSRQWAAVPADDKELKKWDRATRRIDADSSVNVFRAYRHRGLYMPPAPAPEVDSLKSGRTPGAPILSTLYLFICTLPESEIRVHGATAWDFPISLGYFLYKAEMESQGRMHIENQDDIDAVNHAARLNQEILAEQAARKTSEAACPP